MKSNNRKTRNENRKIWRELSATFGANILAYRRKMFAAYMLNFLSVGAALLVPWPLKIIIDNVISGEPAPAWMHGGFASLSTEGQLALLTGMVILFTLLSALTFSLFKTTIAGVRERLSMDLRDRLLTHLQKLPPTIFVDYRSGELVQRLVNDVNLFARLQTKTLPMVFKHIATAVLILATLFWMSPWLALASCAALPFLILMMRHYTPALTKTAKKKRKLEGEVAGLAQEIARGLPSIQALGGESYSRRRFARANGVSLRAGVINAQAGIRMEQAMKIAQGAATALVIGGGAFLVLNGHLTIGALTIFATYIKRLFSPIEKINELATALTRGAVAGEKLLNLLRIQPAIQDDSRLKRLPENVKGNLILRDVSFRYPGASKEKKPVLKNVNISLQPGKLTVLSGMSGSGKSTLMNLLLRLYAPESGEIYIDGQPLSEISLQSWRSNTAVLLQNPHLFAGTIREALMPHPLRISDAMLWHALSLVAMDGCIRDLPQRLDAKLGEDGMNFSGGQRKRLALARAFLLRRPVLLLDEPLANIDHESGQIILHALDHIRRNRTCLVITHQQALLEKADVLYRIENGTVTLSGFRTLTTGWKNGATRGASHAISQRLSSIPRTALLAG